MSSAAPERSIGSNYDDDKPYLDPAPSTSTTAPKSQQRYFSIYSHSKKVMDHLLTRAPPELTMTASGLQIVAPPHRSIERMLKIPFLARQEDMYSSRSPYSFVSHAQETGWETRLHSTDPGEGAAGFVQGWLWFGPLREVIGEDHVDISQFVKDGYVVTEWLDDILDQWRDRMGSSGPTEKDREKRRLSVLFVAWQMLVREFFPEKPGRWYTQTDGAQEILLSIGILAEGLQWAKMRVFEEVQLGRDVIMGGAFALHDETAGGPLLFRIMVAEGWCPSECTFVWKTLGLTGLYACFMLGPAAGGRDHRGASCLKRECRAYQTSEDTYTTRHAAGCDCACGDDICPDIERVREILGEGKIPLISVNTFGNDLDVQVIAYEQDTTPYVAISHVWADGLGNTQRNGLPICQLRKLRTDFLATLELTATARVFDGHFIQARLLDLTPDQLGPFSALFGQRTNFWIDTLCVPLEPPAARQSAIRQMKSSYASANMVWVIDSGLASISGRTSDPEAILLRVLTSAWLRRLWTYQEAAFARKMVFQSSDTGIDLIKTWNSWWAAESVALHNRLLYLVPGLLPGFGRMINRAPGAQRLVGIFENLRWRTTSHARDEPACLATLLDLDPISVLRADTDNRFPELIKLHPEFPADVLFWRTLRITEPETYRWCPRSFLAMHPGVEYWKHGHQHTGEYKVIYEDPSGLVAGFVTSFSGFLFPEIPEEGHLATRFRCGQEDWEWSWDDIPGNEGVLSGETRVGIVMRGPRPFDQAWEGVLVTVWMEGKDGMLFADYMFRVQILKATADTAEAGEEQESQAVMEVEWKGEETVWCIA